MRRKSKLAQQRARYHLVLGIGFILVIAFVVGGVVWWLGQRPLPLDPTTLCPSKGPLGHQVLLVDRTDPFNQAQKAAFDNFAKDIVEKLPVGYMLSVFVLGDDFKAETKPLIELCNPGTGEDKSEFTQNTKALRNQYTNGFIQPLDKVTTELLTANSAKESPIIEMLQLVYLNSIQAHKTQGPVELYVLSDLMQFSTALDMYRSTPNFEKYDATYMAKKLWVDLSSVDVHIILLNNNIKNQSPAFIDFWNAYFKRANTKSLEITNLPG
jgi:hypothetical protein